MFFKVDKSFPGVLASTLFTVEPSTGRNMAMTVEGMAALIASLYGDVDLHQVALRVLSSPFWLAIFRTYQQQITPFITSHYSDCWCVYNHACSLEISRFPSGTVGRKARYEH
jgi:hypothetical protein